MTSAVPSPDQAEAARVFGEQRDLLMAVAYRVLGRVADAEDVVQEAWLRWADARPSEVVEPRAFLVRVTTDWRSTGSAAFRHVVSHTSGPGCPNRS